MAPEWCSVSLVTEVLLELLPIPRQGNGLWRQAGVPSAVLGKGLPAWLLRLPSSIVALCEELHPWNSWEFVAQGRDTVALRLFEMFFHPKGHHGP